MPKRRRFRTKHMSDTGHVIHMSPRLMWELSWVRKLGLEDVDWDPERHCEHCRAERAALGEDVEDIAPPSEAWITFRPLDDGKDATSATGASRARGARGVKRRRMKLVRLPQLDRTLH